MDSDSEQVVCRKATVTDVLTVFLINYLAHAVTVLISPGSSHIAAGDAGLWSLLVPYKGIYAALRIIARQACFGRDALERARRAGALCCVYKVVQDPSGSIAYTYDNNLQTFTVAPLSLSSANASIHGLIHLPAGYDITLLPRDYSVQPLAISPSSGKTATGYTSNTISCDYNFVKIAASLAQTIAGSLTVYQASKAQFALFGFTQSSLTVIPYILMSLTNLAANITCPNYSTLYLVETDLLEEAKGLGGFAHGTVGYVSEWNLTHPHPAARVFKKALYLIGIGLVALPFILIGFWTKFQPGPESTTEEKGWIWSWLITSIMFGVPVGYVQKHTYTHSLKFLGDISSVFWRVIKGGNLKFHQKVLVGAVAMTLATLALVINVVIGTAIFVTPIGMFVTVGRQIIKVGICKMV
ncbi:hypothetical protein OQA88_12660 [Cercophora sp. LCS_1]